MTDPRSVLSRARLTPKKSFGQNFLVDANVTRAIAEACIPDAERGRAEVVELGAGTGALTRALLERASRVVAVERDRDLLPVLAEELASEIASGRLVLVEGDAKQVDVPALFSGIDVPRVLAGNLPYQITGPLLEMSVGIAAHLTRAVFMIQAEVADRLAAEPSTKTYGALTVFVRAQYIVHRVRSVSPGCFFPPPDVTSAVIELQPHAIAAETDAFRDVVRAAFATRRKTLRNAWAKILPTRAALEEAATAAGISLDARGETLDVEAFARMALETERRLGAAPEA